MAAQIDYNIETGYNSVTLGMSSAITDLLSASFSINYNMEELNQMQIVEYSVYRPILRLSGYTSEVAITGEMETSLILSTIITVRFMLIKGIQKIGYRLVQDTMEEEKRRSNRWNVILKGYNGKIGITYEEIQRWYRKKMKMKRKNRE